MLVALAVAAAAGSRTSTLRRLVIDTLAERLDSEVQLEVFSVDLFPTVTVRGEGLSVRLRGHDDVPPLLKIRSFAIKGGLFGLLSRPRKFKTSRSTASRSTFRRAALTSTSTTAAPPIPTRPLSRRRRRSTSSGSNRPMPILRLIPKRAGKEPREF